MAGLQDVVMYFLTLWYKVFSRVNYQDSSPPAKILPKSAPNSEPGSNDAAVTSDSLDSLDREALDQLQISTLLKRERYFRDTRQWQHLRNCYHPKPSGTRIQVGAFAGNIDGFMNLTQMTTPPALQMLHLVDPVEIQLERVGAGRGWKICVWKTIYNRDSLTAVSPDAKLPDLTATSELRKSYRYLAWFISQRGVKMPQNLPGDDDPKSVGQVMKEAQDWLKEDTEA